MESCTGIGYSSEVADFFGVSLAQDSTYYHLRRCRDAAAYAQHLWETTEQYLDVGRPTAAANKFHPVFWEMYLAAALLRHGLPIQPRDTRRARLGGPDLQVGSVDAWVEAVIATPGKGDDAVPPLNADWNAPAEDVPDHLIILRITNAIAKKWQCYLEYRDTSLVRESEPYIIAINGAEVPCSCLEPPAPFIVRSVFGVGSLAISFDPDSLRPVGEHYLAMPEVYKQSGSAVPTVHFRDSTYAGISAVLWGTPDVFNRYEPIGDDLVLVHNPYAANPLPRGWFPAGAEFWAENNVSELRWRQWWKERDSRNLTTA